MTHTTLIDWALGIHLSVLGMSLIGFFKCADRTAMFKNSFDLYASTIQRMKESIFGDLSTTLRPLFNQPQDRTMNVLHIFGPDGEAWREEAINSQETEQYRNLIQRFIDSNTNAMSDFRTLNLICDRCKFWAGYLSWSIMIVLVLQGAALVYCGIIDKAFDLCSKNWPVYTLIVITVCLVVNAFISLPFLLYFHGRIDKYGRQYA